MILVSRTTRIKRFELNKFKRTNNACKRRKFLEWQESTDEAKKRWSGEAIVMAFLSAFSDKTFE